MQSWGTLLSSASGLMIPEMPIPVLEEGVGALMENCDGSAEAVIATHPLWSIHQEECKRISEGPHERQRPEFSGLWKLKRRPRRVRSDGHSAKLEQLDEGSREQQLARHILERLLKRGQQSAAVGPLCQNEYEGNDSIDFLTYALIRIGSMYVPVADQIPFNSLDMSSARGCQETGYSSMSTPQPTPPAQKKKSGIEYEQCSYGADLSGCPKGNLGPAYAQPWELCWQQVAAASVARLSERCRYDSEMVRDDLKQLGLPRSWKCDNTSDPLVIQRTWKLWPDVQRQVISVFFEMQRPS